MGSGKILELSEDDEEAKGKKARSGRQLVLSSVRHHPDGTTVVDTKLATKMPQHRVRTILKELASEGEIYFRKIPGAKATLYYPNGRLIHQYLQRKREFGSQIFRISYHEGRGHPRIHIQERTFSLLDGEKVEGSIFIDSDHIEKFIEFLKEMNNDFENYRR